MFVPKKLLFITAAAFATAAPAVSAASIIVEDSTPASLGGGVRGTRQQQQQQQQQQQPRLLQLNLDGPEWTSTGCPAQPVASGDDCTIPEPYLYQHCIYGPIECNCRRDDPIYVCQPYNFVLIPARPVPPSPTPPVPPPPVPVPTVGPTLGTTIPPIASPVPAAPTSSGGGSGTAPEFTGTTTEINGKSCPSDPDEANGTNCCQFLPRPEGGVGDEASCLYPTGTQCNCPGQLNEDGTSLCSIDGWVCRVILPPAPSSAPAASQTNPPAPTPAVAPYSAPVSIAQGFYAEGKLNFDMTLTGNTNVIGAHLHTGSANTNGPVAVIFCGVAPLPSMNGACVITSDTDYAVNNEESARYVAEWVSNTVDPNLAFTSGVNANTAVSGATSIADGAASSLEELGTELRACTDASTCNVYINIHTNYSDTQNPGLGLARGQLQLVPCLDKDGIDPQFFKCFSASVTSANTNAVPVPNQLPENAGTLIPPLNVGDVLIVWYDPEDTGTGTCAPDSEQCGEYSVARVIQNGNTAQGGFCSVGGGANNSAGKFETSLRDYAVVGGGDTNNAAAQKSVISGGANNRIILFDSLPFEANQYCVISGGQDHNPITGTDNPEYRTTGSVITGGKENFFANPQVPPNNHMTISGGSKISTGGKQSVVTGGKNSLSLGIQSVILGGTLHTITATGDYSAIPGGRLNMAEGTASIAMGQSATALHDHSMVINLQGNTEFTESTDPGQFLVQAKEYKFQVTNDPGPNDENVLFLDANNIQRLQDAIDNLPARRRELSPEMQATEDKISARRIKQEHDRERRHRKVQAIRKRHGLN